MEINGKFDHRLGALEEVRKTVEEFSKGKDYEHVMLEERGAQGGKRRPEAIATQTKLFHANEYCVISNRQSVQPNSGK